MENPVGELSPCAVGSAWRLNTEGNDLIAPWVKDVTGEPGAFLGARQALTVPEPCLWPEGTGAGTHGSWCPGFASEEEGQED